MICFDELLITFHPCCEGLNQPFNTDTVSLQIWGWRLVNKRVNKGSLSRSGIANMDCIILWGEESCMNLASCLSVKTGTNDLNSKVYLCFVPSVKSMCIERKRPGFLNKILKLFFSYFRWRIETCWFLWDMTLFSHKPSGLVSG